MWYTVFIQTEKRRVFALRIAIVDDDIQICESLKSYLDELLDLSFELRTFYSGEAFLEAFEAGMFDLIILDIFMDRLTGMEVAREIRKSDPDVKLVFNTTSNEFASESYEVNACYYLHKPIDKSHIRAMLDRLNLAQLEKLRKITFPDGTSVVLFNIIYADCASHCVTLHQKNGENTVIRLPFSEVESIMCAYKQFLSPTKGVVINLSEAELQKNNSFKMSDKSLIPISRRKAKEVLDAYSAFVFEKLRKGGEG